MSFFISACDGAQGWFEPPTRGFSVRFRRFYGLMNQPLVALAEAYARRTSTESHKTSARITGCGGSRTGASNAVVVVFTTII